MKPISKRTVDLRAPHLQELTLFCHRCGHIWVRRNLDRLPATCPNQKCKSPYWNRPRRAKKEEAK